MAMKILRINKNQHGFTLLEVLVALSILAIGLLATASMQGVAMNSNYVANRISVANMLGQQVLEDLHSLPITDPVLTTSAAGSYDLDPTTASNNITIRGAGTYSATFSTTANDPIAGAGTTRISVTINYLNPANGVATPKTFTTFKMVM